MKEMEVKADDIGTFHATERAQIPSIECPECGTATPLLKLVTDSRCENCGLDITLKMETGSLNEDQ